MKKLIIKTAVKVIILIAILSIGFSVLATGNTIVTNYLAMGQMQADDGPYIAYQTYKTVMPIVSAIMATITIVFVYNIFNNFYKEFKKKNEEI